MPSDSYTLTISSVGVAAPHAATHTSGGTDAISINASQVTAGTLPVTRGGTGVTTAATGTGGIVLSNSPLLTTPTLSSPILTTPALGIPTSGTLTSCTGLPISGLVASTSLALGVGTIELGHATDTTISRVSAGRIAVENVNVVTVSSTDTLTNKTLTSPTLTTPVLGVATATSLAATGAITSSGTVGIGYAGIGAGAAVTQITSRTTTTPTIDKATGAITLFSAAPVVGTYFSFTVPNNTIAVTDTVVLSVRGATNTYVAFVSNIIGTTSFQISMVSISGTASDAPIVNFAIIKGSST